MVLTNILMDRIKSIYFLLYQLTHKIEKNKVLFESIGGKYCDNPRAISEALHELDPSIKIVWSLSKDKSNEGDIPDYINIIDRSDRVIFFHELATSSVFITSVVMPIYKKRKGQLYIQTWHGDRGFKKILYDSEFLPADFFIAETIPGYCDLAIAGSDFGESIYRSAFHYTGEILKKGTPRNDCLLNSNKNSIRELKEKLNLPTDCDFLLYAPTLRRENQANKTMQSIQSINLDRTLEILSCKSGTKWKCLLRAHPAITDITGATDSDDVINVSKCEDMAELLTVSDILITDYSSCAGDFALTGRPVILFHDDRETYIQNDRGFYFKIDDSPYMVVSSQEELESLILALNDEMAEKNCNDILSFYGTHESGNSATAIANTVLEHLNK